jgi:hypothetical protein
MTTVKISSSVDFRQFNIFQHIQGAIITILVEVKGFFSGKLKGAPSSIGWACYSITQFSEFFLSQLSLRFLEKFQDMAGQPMTITMDKNALYNGTLTFLLESSCCCQSWPKFLYNNLRELHWEFLPDFPSVTLY